MQCCCYLCIVFCIAMLCQRDSDKNIYKPLGGAIIDCSLLTIGLDVDDVGDSNFGWVGTRERDMIP